MDPDPDPGGQKLTDPMDSDPVPDLQHSLFVSMCRPAAAAAVAHPRSAGPASELDGQPSHRRPQPFRLRLTTLSLYLSASLCQA
jgi:hypothetical protein